MTDIPSGSADDYSYERPVEQEQPRESIVVSFLRGVRSITEALLFGLLLFLAIRFAVQTYQVEGGSMLPTLQTGERVFVNKMSFFRWDQLPFLAKNEPEQYVFGTPARGDIIVFNIRRGDTEQTLVKRVVGLPGENVSIHDGRVFIDDHPLVEPYLTEITSCVGHCQENLSNGTYFLMGDNRGGSLDSRSFGPVPGESIVGKVWAIYWPVRNVTLVGHDRPTLALSSP
jgi:signal peptidase I